MSFNGLSRRAALIGCFALTSCGFTPAFAPGGAATQWQNTVVVDAPNTVLGYRMGTQLMDAFGQPTNAQYTLKVTPKSESVAATITEDGDTTRFNLTGNAKWVLTDTAGTTIHEGIAQTFSSYSATGTTVATQSAESDARDRLAVAMADLIVQQLLTAR